MLNKAIKLLSEISAGELLDKISILEIKLEKINNKESQIELTKEYNILKEVQASNIKMTKKIEDLLIKVKEVNLNLWNIEDKLRVCEKNMDFGKTFIELARGVYFNNDKRAKIKSEINETLGSNIREIKEYVKY